MIYSLGFEPLDEQSADFEDDMKDEDYTFEEVLKQAATSNDDDDENTEVVTLKNW